ncbi:hypothetical protein XAP412_480015 [Xanthomonas phaseoli pv. phaseoli]|nr:hypothetical protein XAP412_480015 [Xanthomonas phaseoli pv. phaseoli]
MRWCCSCSGWYWAWALWSVRCCSTAACVRAKSAGTASRQHGLQQVGALVPRSQVLVTIARCIVLGLTDCKRPARTIACAHLLAKGGNAAASTTTIAHGRTASRRHLRFSSAVRLGARRCVTAVRRCGVRGRRVLATTNISVSLGAA